MHGAFLKKTLEKEKIGVLNLIEDEHYFTTLACLRKENKRIYEGVSECQKMNI